jgi:hypothetical protein
MFTRRLGKLRRHVTFANVVATLALFVALGGTVYAANKINGRRIKPNSIPGNRITQGSLGATQIDDSKLGQVPSAANAAALGGLPPSAYLQAAGVRADGSASAVPIAHFKSTTFAELIGKSITVPSNGFLYLSANVTAEVDTTTGFKVGELTLRLSVDETPLEGENSVAHRILTSDDPTAENFVGSNSIMLVVPIKAGTHFLELEGRAGGNRPNYIDSREVSALFFPSGSAE